jgi:hypothetical protein
MACPLPSFLDRWLVPGDCPCGTHPYHLLSPATSLIDPSPFFATTLWHRAFPPCSLLLLWLTLLAPPPCALLLFRLVPLAPPPCALLLLRLTLLASPPCSPVLRSLRPFYAPLRSLRSPPGTLCVSSLLPLLLSFAPPFAPPTYRFSPGGGLSGFLRHYKGF